MDYLKTAIALIQEADEEKKRLEDMEKAISKIKPDTPERWRKIYEIQTRYSPTPRKSVINDNLKTARRLLARAYM